MYDKRAAWNMKMKNEIIRELFVYIYRRRRRTCMYRGTCLEFQVDSFVSFEGQVCLEKLRKQLWRIDDAVAVVVVSSVDEFGFLL